MSMYTEQCAAALPAGATDQTLPNSGLTVVFTTEHGAAFRCLACGAGTGVGSYSLTNTRKAARMHREESCPYPEAHHITSTVPHAHSRHERYRTKSSGACGRWVITDDSVAQCSCEWTSYTSTRAEARTTARVHRDEAHSAWLAAVARDKPARTAVAA